MPQLSDLLVQKIRNVIKQYPTDMLMRLPIRIQKVQKTLNRFGENDNFELVEYELLGLQKEFNQSSDIVKEENIGKIDIADGYFLFNFDDLEEAGLIVNNLMLIDVTDFCVANGIKYQITSIHLVGQLVNKFTMVKILVKKIIQNI
jgi:hypothetical protein